jgi:predicted Zn-dependent protease
LTGDREKELEALRSHYSQLTGGLSTQIDPLVEQYFEALYQNGDKGREELHRCAKQPSPYHFQLINFLLAKRDAELAHEAIENAPLSAAWKLSRHAEVSLPLREFENRNDGYFAEALHFKSIGEMIAEKPDATKQLVGDDWFHLTNEYGEWLYLSKAPERVSKAGALLPALIEDSPHDATAQLKLGEWYLSQKDPRRAVEHLQIALEMKPGDKNTLASLGSAFFELPDKGKADETWKEIVAGDDTPLENYELYIRTLKEHGLAEDARDYLYQDVVDRLDENESTTRIGRRVRHSSSDGVKSLVRTLAVSFADRDDGSLTPQAESARAAFFKKLAEALPDDATLPEQLIRESLVAKSQRGVFYTVCISRSEGIGSLGSDADYSSQLQNALIPADAEEALDHEDKFKVSEPDGDRVKWQKEYLAYLVDAKQTAKARKLISEIETSIKGRYARPAWVRLASSRLDIRDRKLPAALSQLRHFAGIDVSPNVSKIGAPSSERLNEAVEMLRDEGHSDLADQLLEAGYSRAIALEQYDTAYFVGLAKLALARHDLERGKGILNALTFLGSEETKPEAEADISSWPWIKTHAVDEPAVEKPEVRESVDLPKSLQLAAETLSQYGQFEEAIGYRQRLAELSPSDETNRIELARLFAASKKDDEAVAGFASIIADRTVTRRARWQAVWLTKEMAGERQEIWTSLKQQVQAANSKDREMLAAIDALSLASSGRTEEAVKVIASLETENPNDYVRLFRGIVENTVGQKQAALRSLIATLDSSRESQSSAAFGFSEEKPVLQVVRLYAELGQPRAALNLAKALSELNPNSRRTAQHSVRKSEDDEDSESETNEAAPEETALGNEAGRYRTLEARARDLEAKSRIEMLGLLSETAEKIGDLDLAVKYESAKIELLDTRAEKRAAESRLDKLLSLEKENQDNPGVRFRIDQNLIAKL